jgi:hypothetical protein
MKIIKITNNNQIKNKNKIKTAILKKDLKIWILKTKIKIFLVGKILIIMAHKI